MQKDSTITIAKAIAIILMVFGHTWVSEYVNRWVGWFHMPLFFFMSGLCFKDGNLKAPWSYVKKKVKGIYVPFVKWSLIFLLLHNVFFNLNIYNDEYGYKGEVSYYYSITDFISHSIQIITKMSGNPQLLGGYWFLETLFVASVGLLVFLIVLNRLEKLLRLNNKILIHLLGGVILLIVTILLSLKNLHLPYWGIGARQSLAMTFVYSGYVYHKCNLKMHSHPNSWIVALGGFLVVSLCAGFLRSTNMLDFSWKDVSLYYLVAICGTLMIYSVSNKICQNESWIKRTLTFIGENTLTILTWHFLCFKIVSILIIAIYGLPIKQLAEFPVIREYSQDGWFLAYLFIGVSVPLCFSNRVSTWLGKLKLKIKNL